MAVVAAQYYEKTDEAQVKTDSIEKVIKPASREAHLLEDGLLRPLREVRLGLHLGEDGQD